MNKILLLGCILLTTLTFGQFKNVILTKPKRATYFYSQVEPSIYINPNNPNEVIAGSVMNDYYYSVDGGETWKSKSIKSRKNGVNGDPCMLIDNKGYYYYFHLSKVKGERLVGGMVCERSKTIKGRFVREGHTIANGKFHDKQWVALNPTNNHIYMTWTQFDVYNSDNPNHFSVILFSKSTDNGMTWSEPEIISKHKGDCKDNDLTAEGAVPTVGPNGEIYVAWARDNKIWFNYSLDEGKTWLDEEIEIASQKMGWVLDIPGIYRCNGLPVTACDISNSKHRGTIYVNWGDQRNGEDNTDIWIKKSTDGGKTWHKAIKVNQDDSKHHQFLSWMTIDQTTGYVYVVYYDRRNHNDTQTDVYLSVSTDGAETFKDFKISETSFKPNKNVFFGDYINISVYNGIVRPIWTSLNGTKISLFTALINFKDL
ncbi:MAG TPA: exo-alpha-sialidase [Crocinitomix sp.]|nr:exo-alpha-sialidase [Crocinitomix sp.]